MLVLLLLRALVLQTFTVVADSMSPTLEDGERLIVLKTTSIERGDLIVFDGAHLLGTPGTTYVKRVIGVPGDQVVCCTDGGLTVNGADFDEPYIVGPSDQTAFDVTVPDQRFWVLGDNRADSADSRSALGRPGGGMLRASDVIGEVVWRYWPTDRFTRFQTSAAVGAPWARPRIVSPVGDTSRSHPYPESSALSPPTNHQEPQS